MALSPGLVHLLVKAVFTFAIAQKSLSFRIIIKIKIRRRV